MFLFSFSSKYFVVSLNFFPLIHLLFRSMFIFMYFGTSSYFLSLKKLVICFVQYPAIWTLPLFMLWFDMFLWFLLIPIHWKLDVEAWSNCSLMFGSDVCTSCPQLLQLCLTLHKPHGLEPARLFCPWQFSRREYWSGLPFPSALYFLKVLIKSDCLVGFHFWWP